MQRLLNDKKAAAYLGVSVSSLTRHVSVPVIRIGARTLYDVRDLDAYVDGLKIKQPEGQGVNPLMAMLNAHKASRN